MPNLASVLKAETSRLARKEVRTQTATMKKASATHRREIAELKRLVQDLSKRVAFLERQERKRVERPAAAIEVKEPANGFRFSPGWVKSHRSKLGISAADYARLVGVSALTIYNWEHGKTRPRSQQLAALATVRALGKREAVKRLELLER